MIFIRKLYYDFHLQTVFSFANCTFVSQTVYFYSQTVHANCIFSFSFANCTCELYIFIFICKLYMRTVYFHSFHKLYIFIRKLYIFVSQTVYLHSQTVDLNIIFQSFPLFAFAYIFIRKLYIQSPHGIKRTTRGLEGCYNHCCFL